MADPPHGRSPAQAAARHAALAPFLARVIASLDLPDEGYHLDAGCGDGAGALAVARERPTMTVLGLGASASDLATARSLAASEGLANANFIEGDPASPPDAMFERVSALGTFNTLADKRAALIAWRKVTLAEGRLVIADVFDPRRGSSTGPGPTSHEGLAQLARESGWRIIHREDLTSLAKKLAAKDTRIGSGELDAVQRYSVVVLV